MKRAISWLLLVVSTMCVALPALAVAPHAGMMRYPDVSESQIAFLYANDLWLVSREGGVAHRLTSVSGSEAFAKFSPDGEDIVFRANYDGNTDLYVLPVTGGVPFRVTHHPAGELPSDWTRHGGIIFSAWGMSGNPRASHMYKVAPEGGLPESMPVPYGNNGAISPDGKWLAYTPYFRDFSTWKRYMGGRAADIWLLNLDDHSSRRITDWGGTDSMPMWNGSDVYYVSDAGSRHRLNIWVYDTKTSERRQVTKHADYDVKWPSIGPGPDGDGEIVYQLGSEMRLLDLKIGRSHAVEITVPGDRPRLRMKSYDASDTLSEGDISATGVRAVVSARGDIWSLPAENGTPQNLTRTNGVAERDPAWSPDGRWIAYFSDETDRYELYIKQSDGKGETRRLTSEKLGFLNSPVWSPNSEMIAFWDETGTLHLHDIEDKKTRSVHKAYSYHSPGISWSSDSNWISFADVVSDRENSAVFLYDVENDEVHQVTSGIFSDTWPVFDRDGTYLFYATQSDFSSPTYADEGGNWAYTQTDRLMAVPLSSETESPFAPEIDVEEWEDDEAEEDEDGESDDGDEDDSEDDGDADNGDSEDEGDDEDAEDEEEPITIDLDGFERRAILLPIDSGAFINLAVNSSGQLLYVRGTRGGAHGERGSASVMLADLEDEDDMEKTVLSSAGWFAMSGDGEKILAANHGMFAIVDAASDQSFDDILPTAGMLVDVDPRTEWRQMLRDVWRIYKYFFYAPNMHGVDWDGAWDDYSAMLDDAASRSDLSYIVGELIGELNVGHAYYFGGEREETPSVSVGMLGCDFELDDGAYRITNILEGGSWDSDARGPLSRAGLDVKEGDYLLAINGVPLDGSKDPWAALQGMAGLTITLTVSEKPEMGDDDREIVVEPSSGERSLRYRAWVEANRAYVEERSEGRVGYIYVPDTGVNGQNELRRQFGGQRRYDALIIDERWNGGGQVPTRFIELLNRPIMNYWTQRYIRDDGPSPDYAHPGPKCMLINESAGSGGDYFPFAFRAAGLGKLVGTRTWGGLVGLSGNPGLIDGSYASVPIFAFYDKDGTWGIEGYGVDPDIEVVDDPALMVNGGDPQLDAAIDLMLDELIRNPYRAPETPAFPDRSGMGIPEEDR